MIWDRQKTLPITPKILHNIDKKPQNFGIIFGQNDGELSQNNKMISTIKLNCSAESELIFTKYHKFSIA